jgi:hypothetical protein
VACVGVDSLEHSIECVQSAEHEAAVAVAGEGGDALEEKMVSQSRGTVKLKIFLQGDAKLFAIYPYR